MKLEPYLALVAAVSVIALAVTLGLRPDPRDERAVAANRTDVNPWAATPTTERPPRLDAPVAAVGQAVAAHEAERASRSSRRDVGGGVGGGGGGSKLDCIKGKESGGDYSAVSPGGTYRGAFQFDRQTWASVGGSGDPANASPAEQDMRAQMLVAQRGYQPWPTAAGC